MENISPVLWSVSFFQQAVDRSVRVGSRVGFAFGLGLGRDRHEMQEHVMQLYWKNWQRLAQLKQYVIVKVEIRCSDGICFHEKG